MPAEIKWDTTPQNTIYTEFSGKWTWAEFFEIFEKEEGMAAELTHIRHDAIAWFKGVHVPAGNIVGTARHVLQKRRARANFGLTIICTDSLFIVTMMNIVKRVHPEFNENFVAVTTLEEGYDLIRQSRAVPAELIGERQNAD